MVVERGYKQTENGIIPEDWDVTSIENCAEDNGLIRGPFGGALKKESFVSKGYKVYEQKNAIYKNLDIGDYYIDKSKFIELSRFQIKGGDFIVSCSGTIGRIFFMPAIYQPGVINQALLIIRIDEKKCNKKYFEHYFSSDWFQNKITDSTQGGAMKNMVGMKEIKTSTFPIPPLPEQNAIATALSDMDKLIAQTEKLIEKKKAIKQGVMQELLRPKEGWVTKKLGEIISEFQNGYGFSAAGYISNGIPIVTMAQIGLDGSFNFDENKVNKWMPSDFDILKNYHLKNGDLIIAMTDVTPEKNLIGRMSIVETHQTLLLNQRVGLLRLDKNKVNPYFLKVLSNMKEWRKYCIGSASLGVQANIGTKDITNGKMIIPSIETQNEITEILIDMENEIHIVMTKLQKLKLQKQGMMQTLLTGKIRLI